MTRGTRRVTIEDPDGSLREIQADPTTANRLASGVWRPLDSQGTRWERLCKDCERWLPPTPEHWYFRAGKVAPGGCRSCKTAKTVANREARRMRIASARVSSHPSKDENC